MIVVVMINMYLRFFDLILCFFANACDIAEMKISNAKIEVIHLSRNRDGCMLQVNGARLKLLSFLGLHSRVTEDKTMNWIPELARIVQ